jgi:iron complex transport system substrate-binding protein
MANRVGDPVIATVFAAVVMAAAAARIVSLSPGVTDDLFAIGAGGELVAIDSFVRRPKEVAGLPRIGGVYDVNIEGVLSKQPTLVAYQELDTPAIVSLRRTDLRVERLPGRSLADDWTAIRTLGRLTDHRSQASRVIARLRAHIRHSSAGVAAKRRLRVMLLLWPQPIWSVARGSFADELLTRANLVNVLHDSPRPWPMLSPETIAQTNPDVLIVDDNEHFQLPADQAPWSLLAAVRSRRIVHLHERLEDGPYIADLLDDIIRAVAPYRR